MSSFQSVFLKKSNHPEASGQEQNPACRTGRDASSAQATLPARRSVQPCAQPDFEIKNTANAKQSAYSALSALNLCGLCVKQQILHHLDS